MRAKIVICDLCPNTTKENESLKGEQEPFILGLLLKPERTLTADAGGADRHICAECIKAILSYYEVKA